MLQDLATYTWAVTKHWFGAVVGFGAGVLGVLQAFSIVPPVVPQTFLWLACGLGILFAQFQAFRDVSMALSSYTQIPQPDISLADAIELLCDPLPSPATDEYFQRCIHLIDELGQKAALGRIAIFGRQETDPDDRRRPLVPLGSDLWNSIGIDHAYITQGVSRTQRIAFPGPGIVWEDIHLCRSQLIREWPHARRRSLCSRIWPGAGVKQPSKPPPRN